jgi:hypothetical protein
MLRALALTLLLATVCSPPAAAQQAESEPEPASYTALIDEAISEYAAGRFEEARALFTRAHALAPNARTLRGLGMAAFELRDYAECVAWLERALASNVKPLAGSLRLETEGLLARARGFIGRFTLAWRVEDGRLAVDGVPVQLQEGQTLDLDVGDHRLELSAPGYASEQRTLRVNGGEARTLELDLRAQSQITPGAAPLRAASSGTGARRADDDDGGSLLSSPWFWIAVGVVAAGTAVGVAVATREEMTLTAEPYGGDSDVVLGGP